MIRVNPRLRAAVILASIAIVAFRTNSAEGAQLAASVELKGIEINCIALSKDGTIVYLGCVDGLIRTWHIHDKKADVLFSQTSAVSALAIESHDTVIASAGTTAIQIADAHTGKKLRQIPALWNWVPTIKFSLDSKFIAARDSNDNIGFFEVESGKTIQNFKGHGIDGPSAIAISRNGKFIATGGDYQGVRVCDIQNGRKQLELDRTMLDGNVVMSLAFKEDNCTVVVVTENMNLSSWNLATGKPTSKWPNVSPMITSCLLSPDANMLLTDHDGTLTDLNTGKIIFHIDPEPRKKIISAMAFSENSKNFALAFKDGTVATWEVIAKLTDTKLPPNP